MGVGDVTTCDLRSLICVLLSSRRYLVLRCVFLEHDEQCVASMSLSGFVALPRSINSVLEENLEIFLLEAKIELMRG